MHMYAILCNCTEKEVFVDSIVSMKNLFYKRRRKYTMKKMIKIIFMAIVIFSILSISIITAGIIKDVVLFVLLGLIELLLCVILLKITYPSFITANRKKWRYEQLTAEEQEMVEEAKKLIKCVDENIIISNFNVYKVKFVLHSWFDYDEDTKELSIFIPFKRFMKLGKNFCFMSIVHEVLHSQNLRNNLCIFDNKFLEGLNQLLTEWLIENFCIKYKIPKSICVVTLNLKGMQLAINSGYRCYTKEVLMVKELLCKSDLREVFLNYINFNPDFFKSFIPLNYFSKQ